MRDRKNLEKRVAAVRSIWRVLGREDAPEQRWVCSQCGEEQRERSFSRTIEGVCDTCIKSPRRGGKRITLKRP